MEKFNDLVASITTKALDELAVSQRWSLSKIHKLGEGFSKELISLILTEQKEYPTFKQFTECYGLLFKGQLPETLEEAVEYAVASLLYYNEKEFYDSIERLHFTSIRASHQQLLQDNREENGLLGKTVPKGKRDSKKPKVDYSVWTVNKK